MNTTIYVIVGAIVLLVILLMASYVKCPPNQALIISGLSKQPRRLIGKGGFKIPFLERIDKLPLSQIVVDVKTSEAVPTRDFINVKIDSSIVVIPDISTLESYNSVIRNFLNSNSEYIRHQIKETVEGNVREAIGAVRFEELNIDREAFSKVVQKAATEDLSKLGLKVLSCNIQNITDDSGLINDLGADNTYKIRQQAAITKANALKNIAVVEAQAQKESNDARVLSETAIAEKNNELEIKKADLKQQSDTKKAIADAAYKIQAQEQQAIINEKTVNAQIVQTKREQQLSEEKIKITENELKASVNKKADADKYKTEIDAAARLEKDRKQAEADLVLAQRQADAAKYAVEKEAEAIKAKAEADRFAKEQEAAAVKAMGEANAYKIEQEGKAEAEKTRAVLLAEAEGLEKKAEAYQKFGQAAILDTIVKVLPDISKNVAEPMKAIQNLNIYSSDGKGASTVSAQMPETIRQTLDVMKSVGVPVDEIMDASTKSAKTDRNIDINGELPINVAGEEK